MSGQPQQTSQQQEQAKVRKPPFADWPTFKIFTPPQGRHSPSTDEWCFTYCTQSVRGRVHGQDPSCRSICLRKVYPHEIRNMISFKAHRSVDAEGKARYPLPAEGQTENLPRLLGVRAPEDSNEKPATKFWEEGWYFWTTTNQQAAQQKQALMKFDLQKQQAVTARQQQRRELWQEYQDQLNQAGADKDALAKQYGGNFVGTVVPVGTAPFDQSMLVHLPPDFTPFRQRIERLLAPSVRALQITKESIMSGEQLDFADRVWKKAQTGEPFELARRTLSRTWDMWKTRDPADEDDSKKPGST